MSIKIDAKTILAFAGVFGSGIVVGAVAYKKRKEFRELIDNKIYPGLKNFVKENGITIYRIVVVTVFEKNPKARALFLLAGDAIEKGSLKIPKQVERMFYNKKDELPDLIAAIEKKAYENK